MSAKEIEALSEGCERRVCQIVIKSKFDCGSSHQIIAVLANAFWSHNDSFD